MPRPPDAAAHRLVPTMGPNLQLLPAPVLEQIIAETDPATACCAAACCRALRAAAAQPLVWRTFYERQWRRRDEMDGQAAPDCARPAEAAARTSVSRGDWKAAFVDRWRQACRTCDADGASPVPGHGVLCGRCAESVLSQDLEYDL